MEIKNQLDNLFNKNKFILDACCGGRMMWLNKHHPNTIYIDNRNERVKLSKDRGHIKIEPDIVMDFRKLEFPDETFYLVVIDPPHIKSMKPLGCDMTKKFGVLNPETWQSDIKKALNECWRVLKPYGTLILKWNDCNIKFDMLLKTIHPFRPLFYNITSGKFEVSKSKTAWFCFMKIPKDLIPKQKKNKK